MSDEFWRALLDPSAPLPHGWPVGAMGAFLLFCVPIGGGTLILLARDSGQFDAIEAEWRTALQG